MTYSHGKKWKDGDIEEGIKAVMATLLLDRMPSNSECKIATNSLSLSNKIAKSGGFLFWAEKLGLEVKKSDSKTGWKYERLASAILAETGLCSVQMSVRHPYDLLVENSVKIDVKASNLYHSKSGSFYSFNLEKQYPSCDIFILFCIGKFDNNNALIVPAHHCHVTHISVGEHSSKWDKFSGKWNFIRELVEFNKKLIAS